MTLDNMTGITKGSYTEGDLFCKSQLITCNRVNECNGVCPFEDALRHADKAHLPDYTYEAEMAQRLKQQTEPSALMSHEEAWEQIDKENNSADSLQVTGKLKKPCDSLLTDDSEDSKEQKSKLDLISRAEVITTLKTIPYDEEMWADVQDSLIYQINDIPSVSAERVGVWEHKPSKSGEWIWWQCSKCGAVIYSESEADRKIHHAYCGVCGARMENKK